MASSKQVKSTHLVIGFPSTMPPSPSRSILCRGNDGSGLHRSNSHRGAPQKGISLRNTSEIRVCNRLGRWPSWPKPKGESLSGFLSFGRNCRCGRSLNGPERYLCYAHQERTANRPRKDCFATSGKKTLGIYCSSLIFENNYRKTWHAYAWRPTFF